MSNNSKKVPSLILGTYQHNNYNVLKDIVITCIECGVVGFDTAPSYQTEEILGRVIKESLAELKKDRDQVFIGTKIDAWQMQKSNGKVESFVDSILKKMNLDYLDQLLIHWPIPEYFEKTWENFINIYKSGKVKMIGVCNMRRRHMEKLMDYELVPMILQNERHPLRTDEDTLKFCKINNIIYEAYSPVGQMMAELSGSLTLKELAQEYNKSIGQIIMRWHIDTGSIPVFMSTKPERIKEYSRIFNFSLREKDIYSISSLNLNHKIFLESIGCPGF